MNPQNNELPAINGQQHPQSMDASAVSPVLAPHDGQAPAVPTASVDDAQATTKTPQLGGATSTMMPPQDLTPAIADDADLIEKEWVVKAKQIVEDTKADPYVQNKEMHRMKAEYIKKRYNKDVKVEEV